MTTTENVRAHLAPEAGEGAAAYVDPTDIGDAILEVYDDHEPRIASLEASGNVGTSDLADSAVTTAKIADSAVTSAKIADGTIVNADISGSAAIAASKVAGTAVTQADTGTVTSAMLANGTIVDADINAAAGIAVSKLAGSANSLLFGDSAATVGALTVAASRIVGRKSTGDIAAMTDAEARTVLGLATTDSPTFAGGTIGSTPATTTLGAELGDGASLTQALTGLGVAQFYQVSAVSGTLTACTIDGASMGCQGNTTSFKATAASHTIVGTAGTATAISVKQVTARGQTGIPVLSSLALSRDAAINTFATATLPSYLTTGTWNSGFGHNALLSVASGGYNSAYGVNSQANNAAGSSNSSFGVYSLFSLVAGQWNTAMGALACQSLTYGFSNSGLGYAALLAGTTGSGNTGAGDYAGGAVTTGSYNTFLGHRAGYTGQTASASGTVAIGTDSVGTGAVATADNEFVLGLATHNVRVAGSFNMQGGQQVRVATKSADYTLTASDFIVQATAVCILTLPTAASVAGKTFKIKNSIAAGGNVTLATTSSQTIDGALTWLVDKYQALTVVSDGTNWMVM